MHSNFQNLRRTSSSLVRGAVSRMMEKSVPANICQVSSDTAIRKSAKVALTTKHNLHVCLTNLHLLSWLWRLINLQEMSEDHWTVGSLWGSSGQYAPVCLFMVLAALPDINHWLLYIIIFFLWFRHGDVILKLLCLAQ